MGDKYSDLDALKLDALREVANIGAGNAATALAELIHQPVKMSVPAVHSLSFDQVADIIGGADAIVAGILQEVSGDLKADLLLLLPWSQACLILDLLLGRGAKETFTLDALEASALEELGNIMANSFLNALAKFTNMKFNPRVPALAVDMAGAVLNLPLARLGEKFERALVIDTEFHQQQRSVTGYFLFIPAPEDLETFFHSLGVVSR
ncbi:MAG: chemotaxis protein CheC [bacterium]|jgi:chemotaxis protein CheC|nr:chemotaxis protein CheC [Bacillota bacterium]HHW54359.1 chemotaxis protein CheC [Bacillota bacterium]